MRFPAPSPSPSPSLSPYSGVAEEILSRSSDPPLQFSPPLIAMVVVLAAAFLFVTYSRLISRRFLSPLFRRFRRWRHRRRRLLHLSSASTSSSDLRSFSPFPFDSFHYSTYSPYGLDDSVIKTLPLFLYSAASCTGKTVSPAAAAGKTPAAAAAVDCAVCLLEFEEGDYVRTLPLCFHAFHLECIDEWLRSHPNCPLCRTAILRSGVVATTSAFVPLMAPRIRPSLDDESNAITVRSETPPRSNHLNAIATAATDDQEITAATEEQSPAVSRFRELKRSYSFDYDREESASERVTMEPATVSPWRYRRSTWSKQRQSPFGNLISKSRVFSLRYHRSAKSPFSRRRSGVFFPISERIPATGSSSSRRTKSMASPMFFRTAPHSSSRLRCGDPEALLSPERWRRRDTCRVDM
ncbi:hypothetical protein Bca4012_085045 [Brassica carinata]